MKIILRDVFSQHWSQENAFSEVANVSGTVVRDKEGRTTQRFEFQNNAYYLKYHQGVGWGEIFKNLLQLRLPIVGASNEWNAIERLHELNLDTLDAVGYGDKGFNPAQKKSFLITKELTGTLSLAVFCETWKDQQPSFTLKKSLIEKVASISAAMHTDGINHRDLYICHFLLDISMGVGAVSSKNIRLFLVDLHRAQMRSEVPNRWLVKDVGSLYFSAMDLGLTQRDVYRFIKAYTGLPLRQALTEKHAFWQQVVKRARRLYVRDFGCEPSMPVT